jgi:hypothetical protein
VDLTATDTRGGVTVTSHTITITDPLDTWTTRTSGTTAPLNDIAFGGGKLVAVGENSGTYRISTDGINWTTGGSIALNGYLYGLIHDGSKFIAVGQDHDGSWKGAIFTSPDGTTWTRRYISGSPLRDVAFGGGVYIASGDAGTLLRSTNGTTWSPVPSGVTVNINGVVYGADGFVAVGAASNGWSGIALTSPDGNSWTDATAASGLTSTQGLFDVEYCSDRFLTSGLNTPIRHSTNGGASFAAAQTGYLKIPAFAHGNGIYFAAGTDQTNGNADINLISTDGVNWSAMATANNTDDRKAVVFFNNTFITVGTGGTIRQSAAFTAPPAATGYNAWQALHFPGSPALSGSNDDFDSDGAANLVEYATGTDPKNSGSRAAITHAVQGGQLILTIPRDPAATDVLIEGERSTLLNGWTGTGVTILENSALQFRASIPVGGGNGFLRANFSVN